LLAIAATVIFNQFSAASAADEAQAATGPPLNVAVFVSTSPDACFDNGYLTAVQRFTQIAQERINRRGGVNGRPIALEVIEDSSEKPEATALRLNRALEDPSMLAIVGLSDTTGDGEDVFEKLASTIRESEIPFITDIADSDYYEDHPRVYSMQPSRSRISVPMIAAALGNMRFGSPAIIGMQKGGFGKRLAASIEKGLEGKKIIAEHRLGLVDKKLDPIAFSAALEDIEKKRADVIILDVEPEHATEAVKRIQVGGYTPAIFLTTGYDQLPDAALETKYPNALYMLTWDRMPEVYNRRLRSLVSQGVPEDWIFTKWKSQSCEGAAEEPVTDVFDYRNFNAVSVGTRFADMVGLIAAAAKVNSRRQLEVEEHREQVAESLANTYLSGRTAFRGVFQTWSFDKEARSIVKTPYVTIKPHTLDDIQLAPVQFVRLRSGALNPVDTLYLDVDLIRTHSISDNQKTFYAEFYLTMRKNQSVPFEQLEFTNAFVDPQTRNRQLIVQQIHDGSPSEAYPDKMEIYKVSGRFYYQPRLASYPFDTQRFSVDIQPKDSDTPFIIQPPPTRLRDADASTEGWEVKNQYVGYAPDFVPVVDGFTHKPSIFPFYQTSFVWEMKRETTDYYLRVVVPLAFILIVAYLSIFIPSVHLEAIVTIQVTALLSAVALYLSLPQIDADSATISDKIFVFDYMMVSVMIVISILRAHRSIAIRPWLYNTLSMIHIALVPLLVLGMAWWVYATADMGSHL
jgi:hypothetical protein